MNRRTLIIAAFGVAMGGTAMAVRADDLTDLLVPKPAGQTQPMGYRQGVVVAWNPVTLQNTVSVGGALLTDLPVLGVAEAASLTPGSVVGLMVVGSTWAIMGRIVTPNTPEATDAITQLGQRIVSASVLTLDTTTSTSFTDLPSYGPTVTANVGASGRVLVVCTAYAFLDTGVGGEAQLSFAMSGANIATAQAVFDAGGGGDLQLSVSAPGVDIASNIAVQCSAVNLQAGLNPGPTTFTLKYATAAAGVEAGYSQRNITVFAL